MKDESDSVLNWTLLTNQWPYYGGQVAKDLIGTKKAKLGRLEEFRSLDAAKKAALDSDQSYPKVAKNKQGMFFVCCKHTARKRGLTIVARKIDDKMVAVTA